MRVPSVIRSSLVLLALGLVPAVQAAEPAAVPAGKTVTLQQCPPAVQQTLVRESRDGSIIEIEMLDAPGGPVYFAGLKVGDREYDVEVRGTGALVMKGLSIIEEGQVKAAELPAPVRATLEREAQGGTMAPVFTRHDPQLAAGGGVSQRLFIGTVTVGGLVYQVEVREDGLLLVKALAAPPGRPQP